MRAWVVWLSFMMGGIVPRFRETWGLWGHQMARASVSMAPMPIHRLLLWLAVAGGAVVAWWCWPDEPAPAVKAPAEVAALPLSTPGVRVPPATPVADVPAAGCALEPPPSPHARALALQRAVAQLASGAGGDAVLALLLQPPAADDVVALAPWRSQVRLAALRSQDAQALRWAAAACDDAACRRELLHERVRVEPDNALHWAALLDEDPAAADEAWQGLAAAHFWREQPQAAAERIARALPPDQRASLAGLAVIAPPSSSSGLADACGHYGPGHAIGMACAHAATLLLEHSDSPAAWQQGAELARQMGRSDVPAAPVSPPASAGAGCTAKQSIR